MKPLCNPKMLLLLKDKPKRPVFEESESIKVNLNFSSNSIRNSVMPAKIRKKQTAQASPEEL
eukprot:CAMPEP_0185583002 /NCGR_PEP_ID=MMETSP0434-20130131/21256_1 /TAXON_ID=626734 ORGANISM="Favella taraikaensis, Strain Fe Narragansett Bay" /NCGR_SAMPLE_ID=MMETSP0434 /ASSEMBLY_ACC=CAM_ASM_000379 /LENGTH=61 /DNA_ID=CAMNT_0028201977 /DNA_START=1974 /DNA_END=2159 /DNA_ORIENTATION=-